MTLAPVGSPRRDTFLVAKLVAFGLWLCSLHVNQAPVMPETSTLIVSTVAVQAPVRDGEATLLRHLPYNSVQPLHLPYN